MAGQPTFGPDRRVSSPGFRAGGYETADRRARPEDRRADKAS
nr:MAG TPA: hypothetical protein [Caudoviricetes sp.]